jgi:hypothetical protein
LQLCRLSLDLAYQIGLVNVYPHSATSSDELFLAMDDYDRRTILGGQRLHIRERPIC